MAETVQTVWTEYEGMTDKMDSLYAEFIVYCLLFIVYCYCRRLSVLFV